MGARLLRLYVTPVNPYAVASHIRVLERAEVGHDKVCFFLWKQRVLCSRRTDAREGERLGQRLKYPKHACRKKRDILWLHTISKYVCTV